MGVREKPIGVLDSGVGGLTVVNEILDIMPREKVIYYGDTLHLPYGPRLLDEVKNFVFNISDFLINKKNVKALVLACNTATSAAMEDVEQKYSVPVFGTIESVTEKAYTLSNSKRIGIIGTEGTVNSQAYQRSLLQKDAEIKIFSAACPKFVEIVEQGIFSGPMVEKMAHKYLDGIREADVDVLILGCTHFPYLRAPIKKVMGKNTKLISSGQAMAREIKKVLDQNNILIPDQKKRNVFAREFMVSDRNSISRDFLDKGRKFLDFPSLKFKEKNIFTKRNKVHLQKGE